MVAAGGGGREFGGEGTGREWSKMKQRKGG